MDQKSQKENARQQGRGRIEYDLSQCDLEFLQALLHASPSPEMREDIHGELQKREWPPPGFRPQRSRRS